MWVVLGGSVQYGGIQIDENLYPVVINRLFNQADIKTKERSNHPLNL